MLRCAPLARGHCLYDLIARALGHRRWLQHFRWCLVGAFSIALWWLVGTSLAVLERTFEEPTDVMGAAGNHTRVEAAMHFELQMNMVSAAWGLFRSSITMLSCIAVLASRALSLFLDHLYTLLCAALVCLVSAAFNDES